MESWLTWHKLVKNLVGIKMASRHWQLSYFSKVLTSLGQFGSVGWVLSCKAKSRQFDSQSWYVPALQVWSPVGTHARGNQSMFLSHTDVSLPFSLPSPLCRINKSFYHYIIFFYILLFLSFTQYCPWSLFIKGPLCNNTFYFPFEEWSYPFSL